MFEAELDGKSNFNQAEVDHKSKKDVVMWSYFPFL